MSITTFTEPELRLLTDAVELARKDAEQASPALGRRYERLADRLRLVTQTNQPAPGPGAER
jgi:hypothetical protein